MKARFTSEQFCHSSVLVGGKGKSRAGGLSKVDLAQDPAELAAATVDVREEHAAGIEIHLPDHYEAKYAYPLIVWLVPESAPRGALGPLMRRISDRNSLG